MRLFTPLAYVLLAAMLAAPQVLTPERVGGLFWYNCLLVSCLVEACFFPYYYFLFTQVNVHNKKLQHFACDKEVRGWGRDMVKDMDSGKV